MKNNESTTTTKTLVKKDVEDVQARISDQITESGIDLEATSKEQVDLGVQDPSEPKDSLASILAREGLPAEDVARAVLDEPYENKKKVTPKVPKSLKPKLENHTSSKLPFPFAKFSLKPEDFGNSDIEYLIKDFLAEGAITLLTAGAGVGKSILSLGITKEALSKVDGVIYVDADMPTNEIDNRLRRAGLMNLLEKRFIYLHSTKYELRIDPKNKRWKKLKKLLRKESSNQNECLCIFDNLKDLTPTGADLDRDNEVLIIMKELKSIRDMGHTVLLLHHIGKDGNKHNPYKNSGSIRDSVDVAYYLERNGSTFTLSQFKKRIEVKDEVVFEMDSNFNLSPKLTQKEKDKIEKLAIIFEAVSKLHNNKGAVLQQNIVDELKGIIARDYTRKLLSEGEDVLWEIKSGDKNSKIYSPHPEALNSKNLDSYIRENIGILENTSPDHSYIDKNQREELPFIVYPDGTIEIPEYLDDNPS